MGLDPANIPAPPSNIMMILSPIAQSYDRDVLQASARYLAAAQQAARQDLLERIKGDGWVSAGLVFGATASATQQAAALAGEPPQISVSTIKNVKTCKIFASGVCSDAAYVATTWLDGELQHEAQTSQSVDSASVYAVTRESGNLWDRATGVLTVPLVTAMTSLASETTLDGIVSQGHIVVAALEGGIASLGLASAAAHEGLVDIATGSGGAFDWYAFFVKALFVVLIPAAVSQAYLLPLLPAISVIFGAVGWAVSLAELTIAIPVVAFLFARMDGDEFVTTVQRPAILLLASVVIRPVFIVMSLISIQILMPLCLRLVGYTIAPAWAGVQAGHTTSVVGIVFSYLLVCTLQVMVANRLARLSTEIPNKILSYVGAPSGSQTHDARHNEAAAGVIGGAVGAAVSGGGRVMTSAPTGGGGGGGGEATVRPVDQSEADRRHENLNHVSGLSNAGSRSPHWASQQGGYSELSPEDQAAASQAYNVWAEKNPDSAMRHGIDSYVQYRQGLNSVSGLNKGKHDDVPLEE